MISRVWRWIHREPTSTGGEQAAKEAARRLRADDGRTKRAKKVSASLRASRERNHYAEAIARVYRGEHS